MNIHAVRGVAGKLTLIAGILISSTAAAAQTKLTWLGHAAFEIVTPKGKVLFVDPWLNNPVNPAAQGGKDAVIAVSRADYILLTHGHFDHVADATELARKTGARLVATPELGDNMARVLGFPKQQMGFDTLLNVGGEIKIADGEVTVDMVPAVHSSGLDWPGKQADGKPVTYGGDPVGFVIRIQGGPTLYHSGDTAYYGDMKLIGENFRPDVALMNTGGHFDMEQPMAARAAAETRAKLVIPMHFKTFPILAQDNNVFFRELDKRHIAHREMSPGSTLVFEGKKPLSK